LYPHTKMPAALAALTLVLSSITMQLSLGVERLAACSK
jgi:hypothetical protein